jgi:transcriptional regulator with XRE-family HTH domain
MSFAENINVLMKRHKLTVKEFSKIANVPCTTVRSILERKNSYSVLIKIANAFHVSADWLLGRDTSKDGQLLDIVGAKEAKRLFKIERLKKELAELQKGE